MIDHSALGELAASLNRIAGKLAGLETEISSLYHHH
jgi:hypothetical protein